MPEYQLEGTHLPEFKALDAFTQGYIEAMFFTESGDGELEGKGFADLAPSALGRIIRDCAKFQADNRADLDEALDTGRINGYDEEGAGRDFWYSRNGHGVGFWDRGLGDIGDKLHKACQYDSRTAYLGDDGKVHLM